MTRTPLVLVHGWAGSAESWDPVVAALDPRVWSPIALRLPGSRGARAGQATVRGAVDHLVSLLAQLPTPAIVVGHSLGAQVTLAAHAQVPDLVLSEVVLDPAYAGEASSRPEMAAWSAQIEAEGLPAVAEFFTSATIQMTAADAERVLSDLTDTNPCVIASYLRSEYVDDDSIGLHPATDRIAGLRRRAVLSVHSTVDSVRREASLPTPPGSAAHLWDGYGHYLHLEDPQRFVALLDEWRRQHSDAQELRSAALLRPPRAPGEAIPSANHTWPRLRLA